jgi:hypothetical protein
VRGVPLPQKYWDYYGKHVFDHNCQTMYRVMATPYDNTPEFFIYTEAFEHLFAYLVQIKAFIDMKLIEADDVKSLKWVLDDLAKPQWTVDNRVFIGRISLDFSDILRLMDDFEINHPKKMSKEQVLEMEREYSEVVPEQRSAE